MIDPLITPDPTNVFIYKILILAFIGWAYLERDKIKKWFKKKVK